MNTTVYLDCKDCVEGTIMWGENTSSVCHVCYGTGQVEYDEVYECIEDAMIDYPDAVEIFFYNEKEEDERKEK